MKKPTMKDIAQDGRQEWKRKIEATITIEERVSKLEAALKSRLNETALAGEVNRLKSDLAEATRVLGITRETLRLRVAELECWYKFFTKADEWIEYGSSNSAKPFTNLKIIKDNLTTALAEARNSKPAKT